ncbi:hypothetical protein [Chryseobacterium sp. SL1]|uniref:hypothetical protein n=1 Tax=Chryseobacterium sp. SL1 TaxID=2995159 RepID=UPI0022749E61|nr:hypothetical protein [Chryseobacterium sp. SL1]MCY1663509.1 hypothetical protein [Chryseobacterium sp. SL1]
MKKIISIILILVLSAIIIAWKLMNTTVGYENITVRGSVKKNNVPLANVKIKIIYWVNYKPDLSIDSTKIIYTNAEGFYKTTIKSAEIVEVVCDYKTIIGEYNDGVMVCNFEL